jgi:hypothetical protein
MGVLGAAIGTYHPQYRPLSVIRYLDVNPLSTCYTLFISLNVALSWIFTKLPLVSDWLVLAATIDKAHISNRLAGVTRLLAAALLHYPNKAPSGRIGVADRTWWPSHHPMWSVQAWMDGPECARLCVAYQDR